MDHNQELYKFIGNSIREHRKQVGLTQDQLAKLVGVTRNSINIIERGQQGVLVHTLSAIARALGVPVNAFLPAESEPKRIICDVCGIDFDEVYRGIVRPPLQVGVTVVGSKPARKSAKQTTSNGTRMCENCSKVHKLNPDLTLDDLQKRVQRNQFRRNARGWHY